MYNSFQYIVHVKISYLRSKKSFQLLGVSPLQIHHQGLCPWTLWGYSSRLPSSAVYILVISLPNPGRLDKTLFTDSQQLE